MKIIAHRGGAGEAPENSLEAFRNAIASGCHGIECDVHLTKDNIPVIIHDSSINRTTQGEGQLSEFTLKDLQNIPLIGGGNIPTLAQALDACSGIIKLQIELKAEGTPEKVQKLLKAKGRKEGVSVTSFNVALLRELHSLNSSIPIGVLAKQPKDILWDSAIGMNASFIGIRFDSVTDTLIQQVHEHGMKMYAYHVNNWNDAERLEGMGVDVVGTDYPTTFVLYSK